VWIGVGSSPMVTRLGEGTKTNKLLVHWNGSFRDEWWSPRLAAQLVLADFAAKDWRARTTIVAPDQLTKDDGTLVVQGGFKAQVEAIDLKRAGPGREERLAEIIAQADSFVDYWYRLLFAEIGRRPYTAQLIQVGVAVGEMAALHWKWHFKQARPSQMFPALLPLIPTPPHPSYPSGHATQAYLIHHCVTAAMPASVAANISDLTWELAGEIAVNREIAGVHFPVDTEAGKQLAGKLIKVLAGDPVAKATAPEDRRADFDPAPAFEALLGKAKDEWKDVTLGEAVTLRS